MPDVEKLEKSAMVGLIWAMMTRKQRAQLQKEEEEAEREDGSGEESDKSSDVSKNDESLVRVHFRPPIQPSMPKKRPRYTKRPS